MLSDIRQFVNWVRRRNPDARTWRDYSYDLEQFVSIVGDRSPDEISIQDVDRFISSQVVRGFKPTTVNRRLAAVTSFYTYLSYEDEDLTCPVVPGRHYLREPRSLPRPAKEEDLRKFFEVIEQARSHKARDRAMFMLMLRCGLRISEVAVLKLSDLFLEEERPRVVAHGKGSRERIVYLSPQTEQALRCYLSERCTATCDFVFLSYQEAGMSTTAIHKRLMRYRKQAGVSFSAHNLRHSFANDLLNADVPVTTIQKLMGHRWLETTQTYVLANDKKVKADFYTACEQLEGWQSLLVMEVKHE